MISWVGAATYRLQAAGTVDMGYSWDKRPFLRTDLKHLHHEGDRVALLEPVCYRLLKHGGGEGPERLASLNLAVENNLHVVPARVTDDRTVTERARAPFHASLKPAHYLAFGSLGRRPSTQLRLARDCLNRAAARLDLGFSRGD